MKSMFQFMVKAISCLLLLCAIVIALLYVTDNQYVIKGLKETYLKGIKTATIYD
ncbi:MAG: hypothetical protein ABI045_07060 [Flavobacteriales bacterium]